jgi:hypothetical protein
MRAILIFLLFISSLQLKGQTVTPYDEAKVFKLIRKRYPEKKYILQINSIGEQKKEVTVDIINKEDGITGMQCIVNYKDYKQILEIDLR